MVNLATILPPNKPKKTVDTPKNFFIYGQTMNGKSYLAGEFPNPLFIDTDGNAKANPYPAVELRNVRDKSGKITHSVVKQLDDIITALQVENHSYETIVLDVIDDIVVMIETAICDENGVETLGDIPYGKGYAIFKSVFQQLVIELKSLPMNVVYVSRITTKLVNNVEVEEPSLPEKHVNVVNGNCDLMVQAKKVGKNYVRMLKMKRKNYNRDEIDDPKILAILDTITGVFERSRSVDKQTQDKIVEELEKANELEVLKETETQTETQAETQAEAVSVKEKTVFDEMDEEVAEETVKALESNVKQAQTFVEAQKQAAAKGGAVSTRKRPKI